MPKYPPNHLLKQERLKRRWTQRDLAQRLGASPDSVRYWEAGHRQPSPYFCIRLCEVFDLPPERLGLPPICEGEAGPEPKAPPPAFRDAAAQIDPPTFMPPSFGINLKQIKQWLFRQGDDENRCKMLALTQCRVQQELQRSLHHAALIALGLAQAPEALANPWRFELQETTDRALTLPEGTSILDVYHRVEGGTLLLGGAGGGKSTLLNELVRVLRDQGEQQEELPIPVIFDLGSWSSGQTSLTEWMIEALYQEYRIRRPVAQEWLATDQLAIFLDGLDEAEEAARPGCIQAINTYHQEHPSVPLVVCCRQKEYFAQEERLNLQQAVILQPLTDAQVDSYLSSSADPRLEVVRQALQDDPELREMAHTPLILSLTVLAYLGDESAPPLTGSKEERRQQIMDRYVERMLKRRPVVPQYHKSQTIHRLAWLARQMKQHNQPRFYLERMQPDWLPDEQTCRQYRLAIIRLIFCLISLVSAGSFALFRGDSFPTAPGLFFWIGGGQGSTLLGWMARGLGGGLRGAASFGIILVTVTVLATVLGRRGGIPTMTKQAVRHALLTGLRHALLIGSVVGLFAGLIFWHVQGWASGLLYAGGMSLFGGLITWLLSGLITLLQYEPASSKSAPSHPNNTRLFRVRDRVINAVFFNLCAAASFAVLYAWQSGGMNQFVLIYGLLVGFFFGLVYGLGNGTDLIWGLGVTIRPAEIVTWSWQAVRTHLWSNLKKGALLGLAILVAVACVVAGISSLFSGIQYGLRYGLVYGMIVGLISGVVGTLTGVLTSGWSSDLIGDECLRVRPNEGIRRSLSNAAFAACLFGPLAGLASGISCGLAFGLAGGLAGWPILGLGVAIILTLTFALQFFILYGGSAYLEHYVLRWYLWRKGLIPWNYAAFLDYADERMLLSEQNGGYKFIHPLLRDRFSSRFSPSKESHV